MRETRLLGPILLHPSWRREQVTGTCVPAPPGAPRAPSPVATEVVRGAGGKQGGREGGRRGINLLLWEAVVPAHRAWGWAPPGHRKPPSCLQDPVPADLAGILHRALCAGHAATAISHCYLLSSFSAEQSQRHKTAR